MRKLLLLLFFLVNLLLYSNMAAAQERIISGTVTSDENLPLSGVTVSVKGTTMATKTDDRGAYSIRANNNQVLVFTFVNYQKVEMSVGNRSTISTQMKKNQQNLDEVVVTAYGAQRSKRELPYQTQTIKGDEVAQTQKDNWINALAGRVAGANITPTGGAPGASTSMVLRGAVSLGNSNQPLFVVDGVPIDNQTLNQESLIAASNGSGVGFGNRNSDYGNRASDINPEDIASVTILKGPEASALYGSDGASGAVVITTKKGRAGKATVTYDNSFRMENVYLFPETQRVYSRGNNGIADPNATVNPFASGLQFAYFGPKYADTAKLYNNVDAFFKTGFTQKHNLTVEGGSDVTTFRLSTNYLTQSGVVPNTGFDRLTIRLSGTAKISPKINVNTSFAYANSITDKASKGAGSYLLNLLNYPIDLDARDYQNPDGSRKLYRSSSTALSAEFDNPFWDVYKNTAQDKVDRITGNFTLNVNPVDWLNLAGIVGLDVYSQTGTLVTHPQSRFGFATNGFYSAYEQNTRNINTVFRGTANKTIGKFSNSLTIGGALDDNNSEVQAQRGERFYEINFAGINNTDPLSRDAKTDETNIRKVRLFSNYVLGYQNMAFLSLAGSREGASTLASRAVDKDIFYNYGSASLSYVFTEMNFLKDFKFLNYGKLRLSYGSTGKAPSRPYVVDNTFVSQITTGGGYAYGFYLNNYDLAPEYTENLEFGGELKFFNNRLSIDITRYSLSSRDQFIAPRTSYGTGSILKYMNGGTVENKGIEAIVNVVVLNKNTFTWDITANFDRNRGTVKSLPEGLPTYYDSDTWVFGNLRSQAFPGASIGNLAGFFPSRNASGDILINPGTGLPITSNDFGIVGDRQADFRVGLINNFSYKSFNLNFNLDFRKGGDVFNGNEYFLFLTGLSKKSLDREQPVIIDGVLNDGLQNTTTPTRSTITIYPYYSNGIYGAGAATEADFIESVNWMRLRDITLSYRLPSSVLQKQKIIKGASVFVTGTDLFIVTNYTGADPSVNTNNASNRGVGGAGIDYGALSTPRGVNAGIKVQF